jgi:hypothetical protein
MEGGVSENEAEAEAEDVLAETEIVHWSPRKGPLIGHGKPHGLVNPSPAPSPVLALGAVALGAVAVGAVAVGALAIGRLVVGNARFKSLKIDRLVVDELVIRRRRG